MIPADPPRRRGRAQVAVSAGLIALAAFVLLQVEAIPADGGYSVVGPRFTPMLIGIGLGVLGIMLLVQALAGGWKNVEGSEPPEPLFVPAFAWIAGGLALELAIIGVIGFTLASTLLFAMVTRGFGSRRLARDVVIGFVLAACIYLFFTHVLGLHLTAGPLRVL